jgi:hypothetical protein
MSNIAIAAVHGHTMLFQLSPIGPNIARMNRCIATAVINEARRNRRVNRPTPNATCTNGATIPKP